MNLYYRYIPQVVNGQAEYSLSDAPKRGGPASTITLKGKVTNTNYEKEQLNWEGQLEIKLKDGKNLVNSWYLKNNPQGDGKSTYEYKVSYAKLLHHLEI